MTRVPLSTPAVAELAEQLNVTPPDAGWPLDRWPFQGRIHPASFEVAVGAVLTQNTRWVQVERALDRLCRAGLTDAVRIRQVDEQVLQAAIQPAGFFRAKAAALRGLSGLWIPAEPSAPSRSQLMALKGIGPETADTILLYGFEQPELIADNYLRRILSRLELIPAVLSYDAARGCFEPGTRLGTSLLQLLHARLVRFGKEFCRRTPRCGICPLRSRCPSSIRS